MRSPCTSEPVTAAILWPSQERFPTGRAPLEGDPERPRGKPRDFADIGIRLESPFTQWLNSSFDRTVGHPDRRVHDLMALVDEQRRSSI